MAKYKAGIGSHGPAVRIPGASTNISPSKHLAAGSTSATTRDRCELGDRGGGRVSIQIRPTIVRREDSHYYRYYPYHDGYCYDVYDTSWPYVQNVYVHHSYQYPISYPMYESYSRYEVYESPPFQSSPLFYDDDPAVADRNVGFVQESSAAFPVETVPPPEAAMEKPTLSFATLVPGVNPLVDQGVAAFRSGRYDEARRLFVRVALEDRNDGYALILYGFTWFADGDYELASAAVRGALDQAPDLAAHPLDIRGLYPDPSVLESRIGQLFHHVATYPGDAAARFMLGYALFCSAEFEPAADVITPLVEADPQDQISTLMLEAMQSMSSKVAVPSDLMQQR